MGKAYRKITRIGLQDVYVSIRIRKKFSGFIYHKQAGSYSSDTQAKLRAERLRRKGFRARVRPNERFSGLYDVWIRKPKKK